jgi:hypothetical protein
MTCRDVVEFLDRFCEGELTPLERMRFRFHLSLCRNCRRYLSTYRKTIRLSKEAFGDLNQPPPVEIPEGLVQAILEAKRSSR